MSRFDNKRKLGFLESIPTASFDNDDDDIASRCKFNFSYFVVPEGKTGFETWSQENLSVFLQKLKDYCRYPLLHWTRVSVGKSGSVLSIYGDFPKKSNFTYPKHVPHQAQSGRFRLDWSGRLCGFVIPKEYDNVLQRNNGCKFDCNTFYVVFIDDNHEFYIGGEAK